jgi:hypothetical protein
MRDESMTECVCEREREKEMELAPRSKLPILMQINKRLRKDEKAPVLGEL